MSILLQAETISAWAGAYSRWPEFDRDGLHCLLLNLLSNEPVAQTPIMQILENVFRRAAGEPNLLR